MSIESDDELWEELLVEFGNGNIRRCPDGTRAPY